MNKTSKYSSGTTRITLSIITVYIPSFSCCASSSPDLIADGQLDEAHLVHLGVPDDNVWQEVSVDNLERKGIIVWLWW